MIEEPKCDYCGEKAVKAVHSFADKDGTALITSVSTLYPRNESDKGKSTCGRR